MWFSPLEGDTHFSKLACTRRWRIISYLIRLWLSLKLSVYESASLFSLTGEHAAAITNVPLSILQFTVFSLPFISDHISISPRFGDVLNPQRQHASCWCNIFTSHVPSTLNKPCCDGGYNQSRRLSLNQIPLNKWSTFFSYALKMSADWHKLD